MPQSKQFKALNERMAHWKDGHGSKAARNRKRMQAATTKGVAEGTIKVRLDARTVITLASQKALAFWRQRYPNLEVLTPAQ